MKYNILLTENAKIQLTQLRDYIAETLLEKDTALKYLEVLERAIFSLDEMPMRYPLVESEPHRSIGFRKMLIKNFYIYYSVDNEKGNVMIHAVIYVRRDQYQALK